ncbi:MAG: YigZ family protein [Bacteroidales bacterium]|nr:YigZ family protein [Bacteroidales bacterium]
MKIEDTYKTIVATVEGEYTEKRSKFLSFAFPVADVEEAELYIDEYRRKYHNARHVCYAYMLGPDRKDYRAYDDGEPSSTAGKPILGQINSNELTNVLVLVIRYFGGIKLGTGGLIQAYREAAAIALSKAEMEIRTVDVEIDFSFEYSNMNDVMRIVKEYNAMMIDQTGYGTGCSMKVSIRKSLKKPLLDSLTQLPSIKVRNIISLTP